MQYQWNEEQISHIIDQSLMYQCACPAQVATQVLKIRELYTYQQRCLDLTDTDCAVHERIASDAEQAHALMESCLQRILEIENWDMQTLTMPEALKKNSF
jgi:hypothetical protein